jgi:hypothetical protein
VATTTYLSNPYQVSVNAVDLTDNCSSVSLTLGNTSLDATAFGATGLSMTSGLQTVSGSLTLFAAYGAGDVEATIYAQVGLGTTGIIVQKGATLSASNPKWTLSGCMIKDYPIEMKVGELQIMTVNFEAGTWVRAIA